MQQAIAARAYMAKRNQQQARIHIILWWSFHFKELLWISNTQRHIYALKVLLFFRVLHPTQQQWNWIKYKQHAKTSIKESHIWGVWCYGRIMQNGIYVVWPDTVLSIFYPLSVSPILLRLTRNLESIPFTQSTRWGASWCQHGANPSQDTITHTNTYSHITEVPLNILYNACL